MNHFYRNVMGRGNVAVSRHAQARLYEQGISAEAFEKAFLNPTHADVREGRDILWRERDGIRIIVVTNPTPNRGAVLVKTVFCIEEQSKAHRR